MTTVAEVMEKAAEIVADPAHWHQGDYANDDDSAFCTIGAIDQAVAQLTGERFTARNAGLLSTSISVMRNVLGEQYGSDFRSISDWNDQTWRQHDEVLAAFGKAREKALALP